MSIRELHFAFKMAKDRIDSLSTEDFNAAQIDWLLNEAALIFTKTRFNGHSIKGRGFEADKKRTDDLSTLVIKYPSQSGLVPTLDNGVYEVALSDLTYPYLHFISGTVTAVDTDNCSATIPLKFTQHDDYRELLRDPFYSPSLEFIPFNYGRASSSTGTSIYIYPGEYTIPMVYLEYLKYPARVSLGTYTYIDGNIYPEATLDLPEHTHLEVVDIATQVAALSIENPEFIQLKNQKIMIHE